MKKLEKPSVRINEIKFINRNDVVKFMSLINLFYF